MLSSLCSKAKKSCIITRVSITPQHTDKTILDIEADDCSFDESIKTKKATDALDAMNNCSMDEGIEPEKAVLIYGTIPEGEDKVEEETTKQEQDLWGCSKLNITPRLKDCIFVCDTENPDTYEKSIASNKAVEWKWFCSWFFL